MIQIDHDSATPLEVRVPATSANLGPGFDVLGLALQLFNVFRVIPAPSLRIDISGFGAGMPRDEQNLFYRSFAYLYNLHEMPAPTIAIDMQLAIPPGSGLGSSATAVVGGLMAANAMLGTPYPTTDLLTHAVAMEHGHHADNVSPALFGGLVVNAHDGEKFVPICVPFPEDLKAVLYTPDFEMDTVAGRRLMPSSYPCTDVIFNTSRVALFLAALSQRRYDLLRVAMQDRLHQPYRSQLFPQLPAMIAAALEAGACGASLSGGGSSIVALASERHEEIAAAMYQTAEEAGITGRCQVLEIDHEGAKVMRNA